MNIPWETIFLYAIREIWLTRNKVVFQSTHSSPISIKNIILFKATEFWSSLPRKTCEIPSHIPFADSQNSFISWERPPLRWHKLNVDGSVKKNCIATGGLIRNDSGAWTFGYSKFLGNGSVTSVEAWSLFMGLQYAVQLKIKRIEIETDSQIIFKLVQTDINDFHPLAVLLSNCRHLLLCFED